MSRKDDILSGTFSFPKSIKASYILTEGQSIVLEEFAQSLFNKWLTQDYVATEIYMNQFENEYLFYSICKDLSDKGWVTFSVGNNLATASLNDKVIESMISKEEIINLRYTFKWNNYILRKTVSNNNDIVKFGKSYKKTGIIRNGFMKAGNNTFKYDVPMLNKYKDQIVEEIIKKMSSTTKEISYQEMVTDIIDFYSKCDDTYTLGNNISDSRGRSIFDCTHKIGNPVSHKPMRALMVLPNPEFIKEDKINDVYLTISELLGERPSTLEEKVRIGKEAYLNRTLVNDVTDDIWLERIYNALDNKDTKPWDVPLELDVTSSILTIMALLTNNHNYMDLTNLINPEENKDAWTVDYCSRKHIKSCITPMLYASSASPRTLWSKDNLEFDEEMLMYIEQEIHEGRYKEANSFKNYIIDEVQPQNEMNINIWNDSFKVKCNRYNWESTVSKSFTVFNTSNNSTNNSKVITREVALEPDLNQFKLFFVTLLCHNLDSQIANHICEELDWVIPNHDAFLVHPNNIDKLREVYINKIYDLYRHRHDILKDYFNSVDIAYRNMDVNTEELSKEDFSPYNLK